MSSSDTSAGRVEMSDESHEGDLLRSARWEQGTIVRIGRAMHKAFNIGLDGVSDLVDSDMPEGANGTYIVSTQTCDIVASPVSEPFVELILCTEDPESKYRSKSRSGTRWFSVQDSDLVVHSAFRITVRKESAVALEIAEWPSSPRELSRFRRWLEKRQGRVSLPDEITDAIVKPLRDVIDGKRKSRYMRALNK